MKYHAVVHFYSTSDEPPEHYGMETYDFEAKDDKEAHKKALELSNESIYADPRIDYFRRVEYLSRVAGIA